MSFGHDRATMLRPGMRTTLIFKYPTRSNMLQQGGQTHRQCCDMLRSNVAIVWPELANAGPTILRYVVMKCCDRLAGALQGLIHGRCC